MRRAGSPTALTRRTLLTAGTATFLAGSVPAPAAAQSASTSFDQWRASFKARALRRGISEATYDRVMNGLKPDTGVYALQRAQPEFQEALWQYLNRRVSDWRIITGQQRAAEQKALLDRIERDYRVDRFIVMAVWGIESSYGEVIDNPKYMRPVLPALAALAWGEPRRRAYWEQELLNALVIVDRGWGDPPQMIGSWAGAMGHTQWMPEVWLNMGVDFDRDGRISPFGRPDDALAGAARYLLQRGRYQQGESWGCEVRLPAGFNARLADGKTYRSYAQWSELGVTRADGTAFAAPAHQVRLTVPVAGGPAFAIGRNFQSIYSYNPAFSYALAIVHLADRLRGNGPFVQRFPGSERTPTLAEVQEIQRRLTALGFDTDGTDGRVGRDTMRAVAAFQRKVGLEVDGYAGLKVLARLRQGG
ncbi:lytic murein transglycosylase [Rhodoplanes serenus]|uniref:Lytic murein transglycosylase n=1 Tax=Rhodoplanes serenus TaxID=200615 RepID=A0A9X4XJR7_9BRAD|nr:lytic murein transglycosylase [Rhodoplanes serenus]MTW16467.1 lytic murein transglycosylase [Rhodoplanes serenus]